MKKIIIKHSATVKGKTYHPNSEGVEMPESHAKSLGFGPDDYMDAQSDKDNGSNLPKGLFMRDALLDDERFNTKSKLLGNSDQLTDLSGIGKARAEEIIKSVS